MHAETVLKLTMQDTLQQAAQNRDAWIRAYREIVSEHPAAEDLAEQLIDRVQRAYAVLEERERLRSDGCLCQDPAYMEEFIRQEEQQEAALDGVFPLGREEDAAFALPYFPIPDLARIQLGFAAQVHTGTYSEYAQDVLVRKGILLEVLGQWKEAERCYQGVSTSSAVQQREFACRTKAREQGEALYQKGMACVEQLDWDGAWYPFSQAADLGHREALAELGFMTVYGTGCGRCIEEGLDYLRTAAKQGSAYACQVLWELHDEGLRDVTGTEAQAWCRAVAEQGNAKALARLEDGFDLRPVTEILRERIGQGDVDALWYLAQELGDTQERRMQDRWMHFCFMPSCTEILHSRSFMIRSKRMHAIGRRQNRAARRRSWHWGIGRSTGRILPSGTGRRIRRLCRRICANGTGRSLTGI